MAISNYGELRTAVANWLNRADLSSYIPDFITLADTRIYYGSSDPVLPSPPVRTWSMQARETPTPSNGVIQLPDRYLSTIRLAGDNGGAGWTIEYVTPAHFSEYMNSAQIGAFYTILNNTIQLAGTGAQSITHDYYRRFTAFASDTDTNALLSSAPGLWLHGALIEAGIFTGDDELAKKSHRMYLAIATGLNAIAVERGGPLVMRAR